MDVMAERAKPETVAPPASDSGTRKLMRLHFELALELGVAGHRPLHQTLAAAVATAGCDIALQLPSLDATAVLTVVRFRDHGRDGFLQIRATETGFDVMDEADIEPGLLRFARSSIDVLERMTVGGSELKLLSHAMH
jgi:hypothetical protein